MAGIRIGDFNFGRLNVDVPIAEPPVTDYVDYTIFHVERALDHFSLGGRSNVTVPGILKAFPDLKVVRAIQPIQKVVDGVLTTLPIRAPTRSHQQGAILLYALLPGDEKTKCSACASHSGNGPFLLCIKGSALHTNNSCLNCYFTAAMARCAHYKDNLLAVQQALHDSGGLSVSFPANAERHASAEDLGEWLLQIDGERNRRVAKRARRAAE